MTRKAVLKKTGNADTVSEDHVRGNSVAGIKRAQTQHLYTVAGNEFFPAGTPPTTASVLPPGIYVANTDMSGLPYFSVHEAHTDELLRFKDARHELVINEIRTFWEKKASFKEMGFTHKRGVLLTGDPGTGKSCLLKLVMEDTVKDGNLVLVVRSPYSLIKCLEAVRQIEDDRKIVAILEDVDATACHSEHALLELFDGDNQFDNLLILATTNYPERLAERMLRPGRFDRKLKIGVLPEEGRLAYFNAKLGKHEKQAPHIKKYVNLTQGFSFAQMREFLVATHCLGHDPQDAAKRVRLGKIEESVKRVAENALDAAISGRSFKKSTAQNLLESLGTPA